MGSARLRKGLSYFDLYDFEPSLTLKPNDLGKLPSRSASYTVNFDLPWTTNNKILLDNIGEPNLNGSGNPNKKIDDIYLEFGSVVYKGFLRVSDTVPNQNYEVYFMTDLSDWADDVKGRKLQDVDLSKWNHTYDINNITDSMTNTDGYIYPLVNYGFWNDVFGYENGNGISNLGTLYNNWFPAVYDTTILKQIFKDVGWEVDVDSELLKEPRFNQQITLFSNGKFQYRTQDIETTELPVFYNDPTGFALNTTPTKIPLLLDYGNTGIPVNTNNYLWDDVLHEYTAPVDGVYSFQDRLFISVTVADTHDITLEAYVDGIASGVTAKMNLTGTVGYYQDSFDVSPFEIALSAGQKLDFRINRTVASGATNVDLVSATAFRRAIISIKDITEIPYGAKFTLSSFLPDINQEDFIKDIIVSYGCVITSNTENKTVRFDLFKSVSNKKNNALDWTDKIDASQKPVINYTTLTDNYGKVNEFNYEQDTTERDLNENYTPVDDYNSSYNVIKLGDSEFNIESDFVSARKVQYKSGFASSIEDYIGRDTGLFGRNSPKMMYIPYVKKTYTDSGGFIANIEYTYQEISLPRKGIVIINSDMTDVLGVDLFVWNEAKDTALQIEEAPYCYFVKESRSVDYIDNVNYNLSWSKINKFNSDKGLLDDYYEDQIKVINRGQTVTLKMRLEEKDLLKIDFVQPFYLNTPTLNGYFIINKIPNLDDINKSIEMEIIKLP
jgi:hypothetical protein